MKLVAASLVLTAVFGQQQATDPDTLRQQIVPMLERMKVQTSALSVVETETLRALLLKPAAAQAVSLDLALAVVRQRQLERTFAGDDVVSFVCRRWPGDPRVVAFYREALTTRGPEAVADLASTCASLWHASFVEPVVTLLGTMVATGSNSIVLSRGMEVMDRHAPSWSSDTTVAPRLSQAVRRFAPVQVTNGMYIWMDLLSKTHDRAMIVVLRGYLDDLTLDRYTSESSNMPYGATPMRYRDLAANAICRLLGEPILIDPYRRARTRGGPPYPEWEEWDRRIVALRQRLDKNQRQIPREHNGAAAL